MKKRLLIVLTIFSSAIAFLSCKQDNDNEKVIENEINNNSYDCPEYLMNNKQNNLNISLLLDLSDRINPIKYPSTPSYFERDLGYIESISLAFSNHVLSKKSILIKDKIQVFLEPNPNDEAINQKISLLKRDLTRDNATRENIKNVLPLYKKTAGDIYNLAIKDNNFIGSDIWRFFKDKAKHYAVEDCYRNILIIITDGYLYHKDTKLIENGKTSYITPQYLRRIKLTKSNFKDLMNEKNYGFIQTRQDLSDLEVLVLGIQNHDKKNPYGKEVIEEYWSQWLKSMDIKRFEIHSTDLPTHMSKIIDTFIKTRN